MVRGAGATDPEAASRGATGDQTRSRLAWACMALNAILLALGVGLGLTGHYGPQQGFFDAFGFVILITVFPVVGVLIAARLPRNPIGWIMLGIGVAGAATAALDGYISHAAGPHPLPGVALAAEISLWSWVPIVIPPVTFLLLLFPDGHLPSRSWRWVAWMAALAMILPSLSILLTPGSLRSEGYPGLHNPLGISFLEPLLHVLFFSLVLVPLSVIACAGAMVVRFRRSKGRERLQLKWLTAAAATVGSLYALTFVLEPTGEALRDSAPVLSDAISVFEAIAITSFVLIPISIGVAILRHRLYDIDRIISRTLAYTLSVGLLVAAYFGLVLVATTFTPLQVDSPIAVASITLLLAAAFRPLLVAVRKAIDRRFNRSRYNAAVVLDRFTRSVRDEVDIGAVSRQLIAAVESAMEPRAVSLWLPRPAERIESDT